MFNLFQHNDKQQELLVPVNEYISRNLIEFLNPRRIYGATTNDSWSNILKLNKTTFMNGWKPTTTLYDSLYDQLFNHYFKFATEIKRVIEYLPVSLQWYPPQWFEHGRLIPSGKMGQVYLFQCRIPFEKEKQLLMVRELNYCQPLDYIKCEGIIGITAIKHKNSNCHKLGIVSIGYQNSLEELIPQIDQWSFQKSCRFAIKLVTLLRDLHSNNIIHPNLQPKNVLISKNQELKLVDHSSASSVRYGRWPYISPEICYGNCKSVTKEANIYSLGLILWQLRSGVIFPANVITSPNVFRLNKFEYVDNAYQKLILDCLQKNPQKRPTIKAVSDRLVEISISNINNRARRSLDSLHSNQVIHQQILIAKYLSTQNNNNNKQAVQDLMQGATLSKRMMIYIAISLERHSTTDKQQQKFLYCQQNTSNTRRKEIHYNHQTETKEDVYCGADLPELLQIGFA